MKTQKELPDPHIQRQLSLESLVYGISYSHPDPLLLYTKTRSNRAWSSALYQLFNVCNNY